MEYTLLQKPKLKTDERKNIVMDNILKSFK